VAYSAKDGMGRTDAVRADGRNAEHFYLNTFLAYRHGSDHSPSPLTPYYRRAAKLKMLCNFGNYASRIAVSENSVYQDLANLSLSNARVGLEKP